MKITTHLGILSIFSSLLAIVVVGGGYMMSTIPDINHPVSPWIIFVGLAMVVLTVLQAVLASYLGVKLRHYLKTLSSETEKILEGRGRRLTVLDGEFGEYAKVFNRMADKVDNVVKSLEVAVDERTDELEEANSRLLAILNSAGESIVVVDKGVKVTQVNRVAVETMGYKGPEEMVGLEWCQVVAPKKGDMPMQTSECPVMRAITNREVVLSGIRSGVRYRGGRPDSFPVQVTAAPLIKGKQVVGAVIVFRDITEETAIDDAKTDFVSLASHQLRTPLSSINWYTEALITEMHAGDRVHEEWLQYIKTIAISSQRMVNLVNSLLNVSRIETDRVQVVADKVDVAKIMDRAVEELRLQHHGRKFRITRHYQDPQMVTSGDPQVIESAAVNLLSNAIKYTPEDNGKINVYLERDNQGRVVMRIKDNGIGIPKRDQPYIFDKLFRTDNAKQVDTSGNGLGLYIVKSLVELVGGTISFESEINKGSVFTVVWPVEPVRHPYGVSPILSQ